MARPEWTECSLAVAANLQPKSLYRDSRFQSFWTILFHHSSILRQKMEKTAPDPADRVTLIEINTRRTTRWPPGERGWPNTHARYTKPLT
jgi:hypothetical protein